MINIVKPEYKILTELSGIQILKNIERVAKTCYRTEGSITEDGESAKRMVEKLIKLDHGAMLEHGGLFTVQFLSDIGFYKDLTRMRLASFGIESTRWCNYSKDKFNNKINVIDPCNIWEGTPEYDIWHRTMVQMSKAYMNMAKLGCKPDQLRMLLPHSTAAVTNISANPREWRHIFKIRTAADVHPSVRQLLVPVLNEFKEKVPVLFDDITPAPLDGIKTI